MSALSGRATDETVADTNYSFNAIATFAKLLSESPDVNVERAGIAVIAVAPNVVEEVLASNDAISAFGQYGQQTEFFVRQFHFLSVANDPDIVEIN